MTDQPESSVYNQVILEIQESRRERRELQTSIEQLTKQVQTLTVELAGDSAFKRKGVLDRLEQLETNQQGTPGEQYTWWKEMFYRHLAERRLDMHQKTSTWRNIFLSVIAAVTATAAALAWIMGRE